MAGNHPRTPRRTAPRPGTAPGQAPSAAPPRRHPVHHPTLSCPVTDLHVHRPLRLQGVHGMIPPTVTIARPVAFTLRHYSMDTAKYPVDIVFRPFRTFGDWFWRRKRPATRLRASLTGRLPCEPCRYAVFTRARGSEDVRKLPVHRRRRTGTGASTAAGAPDVRADCGPPHVRRCRHQRDQLHPGPGHDRQPQVHLSGRGTRTTPPPRSTTRCTFRSGPSSSSASSRSACGCGWRG